jgi:cation transport ATPase
MLMPAPTLNSTASPHTAKPRAARPTTSPPRAKPSAGIGQHRSEALAGGANDDIVQLRTGDQIVADGVVRASVGMQVDESLLTSESDPVDKSAGDEVLSGSFVVSASGRYQSTAVGADAYTRKLAAEAR